MVTKIPAAVAIAVTILFLAPIVYLITATSPDELVKLAQSRLTLEATLNSFVYATLSAVFGVLIGALYAWLVNRTNVPGKALLQVLIMLPLGIPQFIKGLSWIFLFSPNIGLLNVAFDGITGSQSPLFNIFSLPGMVLVSSLGTVSLSYLIITGALAGVDSSLEESARVAGMSTLGTFFRVTLPMLRPAILAAFLLNFLGVFSLFDIAFIIGLPAKVFTLITLVYSSVNSTIPDYSYGASLSIIYLAITVSLAAIYIIATRSSFRFAMAGGRERQGRIIELGRWRYMGLAVCLVVLTFAFFLPAATIFLVSLTTAYNGHFSAFLKPTLDNYQSLAGSSSFWSATQTSFVISFGTAVITMFLATMFAYAIIRSKAVASKVFDFLGFLPTAFPGVVYDLGLLWAFIGLPFISSLYGTVWPIILALVAVWLPRPIRIMTSRMVQISPELEGSASVMGMKWTGIYRKILLPLLAIALFNSFVYVFVDSFRELGAVSLLGTGQTYTLTLYIQQLYANSAGSLGQVAAISGVMTGISVVILAIGLVVLRRKSNWLA